tara:strand:+ start:647 stop:850 length:204 start_codon:yes stop_codon:yes gene_type:complete
VSLKLEFKRWEWGNEEYKWQGMLYHDGAMVKITAMHPTRYEAKVELKGFLELVRKQLEKGESNGSSN